MNDKHTLQKRFQRLLLARLTARYGRVPTCSRLARDFSLIAADVAPISNETARKWLRGDVMPHASRLKILCAWLDIDFARMNASEPPATTGQDRELDAFRQRLCELMKLLDAKQMAIVYETTRGLLTQPR